MTAVKNKSRDPSQTLPTASDLPASPMDAVSPPQMSRFAANPRKAKYQAITAIMALPSGSDDETLSDYSDDYFSDQDIPATFVPKHYPGLEQTKTTTYISPYKPLPQSQQTPKSSLFLFKKVPQSAKPLLSAQQVIQDVTSSLAVQQATRAALGRNRGEESEVSIQAERKLLQLPKRISKIPAAVRAKNNLQEQRSGPKLQETVAVQAKNKYFLDQHSGPELPDTGAIGAKGKILQQSVQSPQTVAFTQTRGKYLRDTDPEKIAAAFRLRMKLSQQLIVASSAVSGSDVCSCSAQNYVLQQPATMQQTAAELALMQLLPPVLTDIVALIHDQKILANASDILLSSFNHDVLASGTDLMMFCREVVEIIQDPVKAFGSQEANPLIIYHAVLCKFEHHWTTIIGLLGKLEKEDGGEQALYQEGKSWFMLLTKASQPDSIKNNSLLKTKVATKHAEDLRGRVMGIKDGMSERFDS